MIFSDEIYGELGEELLKQVDGKAGRIFGVVELSCGSFEFIFGFEYMDNRLDRWLDIAFECGTRCSTDFDVELLKKWLQNTNRK